MKRLRVIELMGKNMTNKRDTQLLSILVDGERYGLDIRNEYKNRFGRTLHLGPLYVSLDRMEDKGWLKSRMGESGPHRRGRRKKYYCITALGKVAFK